MSEGRVADTSDEAIHDCARLVHFVCKYIEMNFDTTFLSKIFTVLVVARKFAGR